MDEIGQQSNLETKDFVRHSNIRIFDSIGGTFDSIGILDPNGININPLTEKEYTDEYKKLGAIWSTFPAYENAKEIIKDITDNQVLLVISGTGSGKTVLIPKYVLHSFAYKGKIAITLPKQVIALSSADFAAKTLDVELGKEVGYKYRGSPKSSYSSSTKLLYATDGTIVAKLINDPYLKDFDAVIIDEAHERKVQIDFLLYLLRETLKLRPDFKIIIMSATIDALIFKNYFTNFKFKNINIGGKTNFPIKSIFNKKHMEYDDIVNYGFDILVSILETDDVKKKGAHDIIFFVTSQNEATDLCKKLANYIDVTEKDKCRITCEGNIYCIEVYAKMSDEKKELAQHKSKYKEQGNYSRKLVIATPVAESSLTIDGIKYVIDSGYEFKSSYDPKYRARRLDRVLITHAQAKQRMGRSGRTESGICYHLYTEQDFEENMERFPLPDIRTSDISQVCLSLLSFETINDIPTLVNILEQFIEPPKKEFIEAGIQSLMQGGIIGKNKVTELGNIVVNMKNHNFMHSIAIIYGKIYNCSREIINIVALMDACNLNMNNIFITPSNILSKNETLKEDENKFKKELKKLDEKFIKAKNKFKHKYGDHLSMLKIMADFQKIMRKYKDNNKKTSDEALKKWAHENFINLHTIKNAYKYNKNLYRSLKESDAFVKKVKRIDDVVKMEIDDRILFCLTYGLKNNTATKIGSSDYYKTQYAKDINIDISDNSFLILNKSLPTNVFYGELFISMGNANLNMVSIINKKITDILLN